jgi:hypothetical protein
MVPQLHFLAVFPIQNPAALISAQDAAANLGLYGFTVACIQFLSREEAYPLLRNGPECAVEDP